MKISSINNEKVVYWAKLKMKKYRDIEHLFIVESRHLVEEAIKKGIVQEIITTEDYQSDYPTYNVTSEIMKRISSLISPPSLMAVCKYIAPSDITGNVLLLDKIQDPGNLGTIIRSAIAFNFQTIIASSDTVDFYNDKVIRSSEGMLFNINFIRANLLEMIPILKEKGYYVLGTDVIKGFDIRKIKKENVAIIIGNEGQGMSFDIRKACDGFVNIPMNNRCESLNAAVASSIIMYEVFHE